MTNEELKEKICDIIAPYVSAYGDDERIADALIAAGLTFEPMTFRIVENKPYSYTAGELANWEEDQDRIAKLLHRAEVAERALGNACEDVKEIVSFLIELSERVDGLHVEGYLPEESEPKAYINRAEKELAEEGKDEQS